MAEATPDKNQEEQLEQLTQAPSRGLIGEFWGSLRENNKWFLVPIIVVLLLVAILLVLASTVVAPFIYTIF